MAELLIVVGGVAAGTQLFHYGMKTLTAAAALPRYNRHAPEIVKGWTEQVAAMLHCLDTMQQRIDNLDSTTIRLLDLCRKDAVALLAILLPSQSQLRLQKHGRLRELVFVLRKEREIEALIKTFDQKFTRTMLSLLWLSSNPSEHVTQADLKANQVVSQQDRIQLTKTIEDVISTASFFDDSYVPVELLAKLADPAMLSEALSALVACMSFDPTYSPSYVKLNTNLRQRMQSQLLVSLSGQVYLNHALDALCSRFPTTFTHQRTMRIGQELHLHVLSTVSAASGYSLERDIFLRVASLTFHVCRYLLAAGRYTVISGLLSTFRQRFLPELRADLDLDTRLRGKECVTMKLQGNVSDALRISRDIYHLRREAFGMMNERTIHSLNNKGLLYHATGDYASANRCLSEALDLHAEMQGNDHPDTLITANNLGIILQSQGRYNDANLLFSRSLVGMTYACGKDCLDVLAARSNLGTSMHHQKRYHEARSHHQYVYERRCDILGPESHETVKSKANLAITINELGDHEKAEKMCREAARSLETELGHSHPDALKTHINLAAILFDRGNYTEAEDTIRTTLPMMDEKYGPTHPRTLRALEFRAILLHHMGSLSAAFAIMTQLVQVQRERTSYAPPDPDLQRNLDHVKELEADIERSHSL